MKFTMIDELAKLSPDQQQATLASVRISPTATGESLAVRAEKDAALRFMVAHAAADSINTYDLMVKAIDAKLAGRPIDAMRLLNELAEQGALRVIERARKQARIAEAA